MKLENQACTLKQAKEFDELGLKLESYFVWDTGASQARLIPRHNLEIPGILYPKSIAAYSYAELAVFWDKFILEYSKNIKDLFWLKLAQLPIQKIRAHNYADRIILILKLGIIKPKDLTLEEK